MKINKNKLKEIIKNIILEESENPEHAHENSPHITSQNSNNINIIGYHGSALNNLSKSNIGIFASEIKKTWSHQGTKYGGFYITMPAGVDIQNTNSIQDTRENLQSAKNYAIKSAEGLLKQDPTNKNISPTVYEISISIPRNELIVSDKPLQYTRLNDDNIKDLISNNTKFIYKKRGIPSAEGIILDKNIINSIKKIDIESI